MIAETGAGTSFNRSLGGTGCLAMWQCTHSIGSEAVNGRRPGQHLVKRDAERVEIAPGIDRAVHSPGLFGRHVGECSGDELGRFGRLALARKARSDPEARQPDLTRRGIDQNIGRLDVLVDQLLLVQPAECRCETDGEAQELRHLHRSRKESIESLAARIFEHEHRPPALLGEGQGPNRPG